MVLIFTDTTSLLSAEFVSTFSAEKLAITLFRISQDIGVEFSQAQKSFSIVGDWSKVIQAHSSLVEYFEKEQHAKQEEQIQQQENSLLSQNQNSGNESRRGRKPGCTVAKTPYNAVPEPYVEYLNDQGLPVNVKTHKREKHNQKKDDDESTTEKGKATDLCGKTVSDKHKDVEVDKSKSELRKNLVNDGEEVTIKEEFDSDAMDEDTDIDEQFLDNSDSKQSASICLDKIDSIVKVKVKVEKAISDDEKIISLRSKRKAKPQKMSPKKPSKKREKSMNVKTKKGKVKTKLAGIQADDGKKKKNKNKKVTKEEKEDKEFKCDKCEYVGKKRENLREHTQRMHRNKFKCETCSKQFGLHKDLLRHTRHVHTNPAYHCKICDKFYKFSRAYKEHMLSHEDNYVKPQFECEICHKVFSTKYVLTAHVKSEHLGMKKSFMCPTCGRSFTQKNSYLMHANVHAGIKPYVCDVCGKAFSYDKSLKEHKYMHDDERRFSCEVCAKTFRQKTSLLMHMKVHKDERDYICTSCGKGFTQKQALLRHERIHSGDKPFKCALCSRSFNDYSIIRRHMMMHHKRDKDPKTWRGDIICSLKRKTEFYIEGGPGYNGGDRLPTAESDSKNDTSVRTVEKSASHNNDMKYETDFTNKTKNSYTDLSVGNMKYETDFTNKTENSYTDLSDGAAQVTQSNSENFVPSNTETQTSLPDCSGVRSSYDSQEIADASDTISKLQETDTNASPSLPINYSLPTTYQTVVAVSSGPSSEGDDIQRQFQDTLESYRNQGQRREMFMQNLTSMAPLPALAQNHQLPPVSGDTTQGQPLPNPWGLAGYPYYYSPANFSHYQGPQS